jgi:hypothetical protein
VKTHIRPLTQFLRDDSQSVITFNSSPDIPFSAGLNPYAAASKAVRLLPRPHITKSAAFPPGSISKPRCVKNAPGLLRANCRRNGCPSRVH